MEKGPLRVVRCSGSPNERGNQYGAGARDLISRLVQSHYSYYSTNFRADKDQVLKEARKYVPFIEEYSSDIMEEIRGTAEGAGVALDELVMVIAFPEMLYPRMFRHCTAFALGGEATVDGAVYVGQNNDESIDPWLNGECSILVNVNRKEGPEVLTYTYAGQPAAIGMNSAGIAMCINALGCEQSQLGVPVLVVNREILYQKTIGDAIGAIARARRGNSLNYVIADTNGELYDIEAAPSEYDYIYSDKMIVHTNHFLSQRIKIERDLIKETLPDSIVRLNRMRRLMEKNLGKFDLKSIMSTLRDHVNYPNSICRHPNLAEPEHLRVKTLHSMIWIPERQEAWLAKDPPCQGQFYQYGMDGTLKRGESSIE